MTNRFRVLALGAVASLTACAAVPTGPSSLALPGTGKSFELFRADDADCRQYATAQVGGATTQQAAADSTLRSAAVGTAVGALVGAAVSGSPRGAGVGAGTGLLFGTAAGTGAAAGSAYELQRRYDHGYLQCMYAKGHRVPVSGYFTEPQQALPPGIPPPPPGMPPPPPPGVREG
jgi:hypothetical protein